MDDGYHRVSHSTIWYSTVSLICTVCIDCLTSGIRILTGFSLDVPIINDFIVPYDGMGMADADADAADTEAAVASVILASVWRLAALFIIVYHENVDVGVYNRCYCLIECIVMYHDPMMPSFIHSFMPYSIL